MKIVLNKKAVIIQANLRPKVSNILNKNGKNSYLFVLGGNVHVKKVLSVISFAKDLDEDNRNIQIYIRPQPTFYIKNYQQFIIDLNFNNEVIFQNTKELKH